MEHPSGIIIITIIIITYTYRRLCAKNSTKTFLKAVRVNGHEWSHTYDIRRVLLPFQFSSWKTRGLKELPSPASMRSHWQAFAFCSYVPQGVQGWRWAPVSFHLISLRLLPEATDYSSSKSDIAFQHLRG